MSDSYQPIACGIYDELEVLAMRRLPCKIEFLGDENEAVTVSSRIVDVFARSGEEFIRIEDGRLVRLDRLMRVNDRDASGACKI